MMTCTSVSLNSFTNLTFSSKIHLFELSSCYQIYLDVVKSRIREYNIFFQSTLYKDVYTIYVNDINGIQCKTARVH